MTGQLCSQAVEMKTEGHGWMPRDSPRGPQLPSFQPPQAPALLHAPATHL